MKEKKDNLQKRNNKTKSQLLNLKAKSRRQLNDNFQKF